MVDEITNATVWDRTMDVLILGAGFSCAATSGDMPLMGDFFHGLDVDKYPALHKALECLGKGVDTNVEDLLLILEQIESSPSGIIKDCMREISPKCITKAKVDLERYCIERLCRPKNIYSNWASSLLLSCDESTTIITLNYDNLAERLLSNREGICHHSADTNCPHCKMTNILWAACGCEVKDKPEPYEKLWKGALLKLHGSVAWSHCTNRECCQYQCLIPDIHCRQFKDGTCEICGEKLHPVIVLPSMQKDLNRLPEIDIMWRCATAALADAATIGIIGFSFPKSDALFAHLFKQGGIHKEYEYISIIDINPEQVAERVTAVLPNGHKTVLDELPVIPNKEPEWLPKDGVYCKYPPQMQKQKV